jgi:hypothetical protein
MSHVSEALAGYDLGVSMGGEIKNLKFDVDLDIPDATSSASGGYKEFIGCLRSSTGSFEALTPCGLVDSYNAIVLKASNTTGDSITCDIIITSVKESIPVEGIVTYTYTFESNGSISGIGI